MQKETSKGDFYNMDTAFLERTAALAPQLTATRRDFHKHAETGWLEMRTASLIAR